MKRGKISYHGFALVELLIVIAILAILAIIGSVLYSKIQETSKQSKVKQDVEAIQKAYENKFDNTARIYKPIGNESFASGILPKTPFNTDYNIIFNVTNDGFRVCGPLKSADQVCTKGSNDCYCVDSVLGKYKEENNGGGQATAGSCISESDHPYIPAPNGGSIEYWYTITNPDTSAQATKIHFNRIDMADDVLFIYDNDTYPQWNHDWTQYPCFTNNTGFRNCLPGNQTNKDVVVDGNVVKVRLWVDAGTGTGEVDWGFCVDQVSTTSLP